MTEYSGWNKGCSKKCLVLLFCLLFLRKRLRNQCKRVGSGSGSESKWFSINSFKISSRIYGGGKSRTSLYKLTTMDWQTKQNFMRYLLFDDPYQGVKTSFFRRAWGQSGLRNTDGLLAHRWATIQPTDELLHFRLKNGIVKKWELLCFFIVGIWWECLERKNCIFLQIFEVRLCATSPSLG